MAILEGQQNLFVTVPDAGVTSPDASTAGAETVAPATDASQAVNQVIKRFRGWSLSLPSGSVFGHGTGNESPFGRKPPPWRRMI